VADVVFGSEREATEALMVLQKSKLGTGHTIDKYREV
jgi:hypothetical protein